MLLFSTERLEIRSIQADDRDNFELLCNHPMVREKVPQPEFTPEEVNDKFNQWLNLDGNIADRDRSMYGVFVKGNSELMGIAMFLTNDEGDRELGYRFLPEYWRKGYGSEVTKGIIDYCFEELKFEKITADANIENVGSIKILDKFLHPVRDFFNERDQCTDRRYELYRD